MMHELIWIINLKIIVVICREKFGGDGKVWKEFHPKATTFKSAK